MWWEDEIRNWFEFNLNSMTRSEGCFESSSSNWFVLFYCIKLLQRKTSDFIFIGGYCFLDYFCVCLLCSIYCSKIFGYWWPVTFTPLHFWRALFPVIKPGLHNSVSSKNNKNCVQHFSFWQHLGWSALSKLYLSRLNEHFLPPDIIMNLALEMSHLAAKNSLNIKEKILREPLPISVHCT